MTASFAPSRAFRHSFAFSFVDMLRSFFRYAVTLLPPLLIMDIMPELPALTI